MDIRLALLRFDFRHFLFFLIFSPSSSRVYGEEMRQRLLYRRDLHMRSFILISTAQGRISRGANWHGNRNECRERQGSWGISKTWRRSWSRDRCRRSKLHSATSLSFSTWRARARRRTRTARRRRWRSSCCCCF